jgi:hypothetical protein
MIWVLIALAAAGIGAGIRVYFGLQKLRAAPADDWDARMIERVRAQGVDPFRPLDVDFFFALPDDSACNALRTLLQGEEYVVDVRQIEEGASHSFSLHASKPLRLAVPDMQAHSRRFRELAAAHGGRYDGWAAGATR